MIDAAAESPSTSGSSAPSQRTTALYAEGPANEQDLFPEARWAGDLFFSTGISGDCSDIDPDDAERQIAAAFAGLGRLLDRAGLTAREVGQVFVWLTQPVHLALIEPHWSEMFGDPANRPARHAVFAPLRRGRLVELEIIAVAGGERRSIISLPEVAPCRGASPNVPLAAIIGDYFFSSTIVGSDDAGNLPEDPAAQIERVFDNAVRLLEKGGFSTDDAAHVFVWQRDHNLRKWVNNPWARIFPDKLRRPARHALRAESGIGNVELTVVAVRGGGVTLAELGRLSHTGEREPGFLPLAAVRGGVLFSSANFGIDLDSGAFIEELDRQIEVAFAHTVEALKALNFRVDEIAHVYIWNKGGEYRGVLDALWRQTFPDPARRPVRHDVEAPLPGSLKLQIELTAIRNPRRQE